MENEFVTYEIALRLKSLGFNKRCMAQYDTHINNEWILNPNTSSNGQYSESSPCCVAPTLQSAFKWFRKNYGYNSYIALATKYHYRFHIEKFDETKFAGDMYDTDEEAQEACLLKLCEIVENQKL